MRQLALAMLACCVLAGCRPAQAPVALAVLIGGYVYKSEDPEDRPTDHEWDHLTLRDDGKYDLVQGGSTKLKSETVGDWKLWPGAGDGPRVVLDHSGYPIEIDRNKVRLMIDYDTGIWYEKVK
jgi:hypothetical protein